MTASVISHKLLNGKGKKTLGNVCTSGGALVFKSIQEGWLSRNRRGRILFWLINGLPRIVHPTPLSLAFVKDFRLKRLYP